MSIRTRTVLTLGVFAAAVCGFAASPADAAVIHPATATNCIFTSADNPNGLPIYIANCTDTPTGQWQIEITCSNIDKPHEKPYVETGEVRTGSGQSEAMCLNVGDDATEQINNIR
jgi:hypothetical protein